jgi:superfamily II DNA or RNA helicase
MSKSPITTTIGTRGYTIAKDEHNDNTLKDIRKELSVKPFVNVNYANDSPPFSIYLESNRKLYLPRYYGIERFGPPSQITIPKGDKIDIQFNGSIKPKQKPIVDAFMKEVTNKNYGGGIISVPCGYGKCLDPNTGVLMFNGFIKKVKDILVGDYVMGDDSTPRKVISLGIGHSTMYKIIEENTFDLNTYTVNECHILSLLRYKTRNDIEPNLNVYEFIDIDIRDYLKLSEEEQSELYGYRRLINFQNNLTNINKSKLYKYIKKTGNLPYDCIISSIEIRLIILSALIDKYSIQFKSALDILNKIKYRMIIQRSKEYVDRLMFLIRSLGISTYAKQIDTNQYSLRLWGHNLIHLEKIQQYEENPWNIIHKIAEHIPFLQNKSKWEKIIPYKFHIEKQPVAMYNGIAIDGNHRFVLEDCSVTHNTVLGLYLASQIGLKTIVIVHKEFLMNQWIERIEQFLPNARVGKIQGSTIQKDNKDIVLAMLQSVSMLNYDKEIFDGFGMAIFDECHHLGAEVFSRSLMKINCPYTLGLSATPKRNDGLTTVFHWYLGPTVYQIKKREDKNVLVHIYKYYSEHPAYSQEVLNFMGKLNMAQMINNITSFTPRIKLIFDCIQKHLAEGRKILVLSDRKNHLAAIKETFENHAFSYDKDFQYTIGYYLGGMKQADLEKTEKDNVILGTFAMASEGFDCRDPLDTIILASPKTSIEQAVGRILRQDEKDRKFIPLVIDIVDCFSSFERQALKRVKFYKGNEYTIEVYNEKGQQIENAYVKKKKSKKTEEELLFHSDSN